MKLYRVMSAAEYADLHKSKRFRKGPNSFEQGKWFAESLEDSISWGLQFERIDKVPHRIVVSVVLDESVYLQQHRQQQLDGVGPGVYVMNATLNKLVYTTEVNPDE